MSYTIQGGSRSTAKGEGSYAESDEHVADPTAQTGTVETSGTSGTDTSADAVSPVFDEASKADLAPEETVEVETNPAVAKQAQEQASEQPPAAPSTDFDASKDPADYKVAEILAYLETASQEDVAKVQEAEKAGQGRKTIMGFKKS